MVILRPIFQVGCVKASAIVTGGELFERVIAKGSAAGREDDTAHFVASARLQRLKDGAVFAVDGMITAPRSAASVIASRRP